MTIKCLNLANTSYKNFKVASQLKNTILSKWNHLVSYFIAFWKDDKTVDIPSWTTLIRRMLLFVLTFFVFEQLLFRGTTLPFELYSNDTIYIEFLKKRGIYLFLVLIAIVLFFHKRLFFPWSAFEKGKSIRLFTVLTATILTWVFATYDYNFYFGQWHLADRILLVIALILVYLRPIFVLAFLTVLLPIIGQMESLRGFSMAAPFLPIRILILFGVFVFYKLLRNRFRPDDFVFLTVCLVAAHYFSAGIRKVSPQWILNDQIHLLLPTTYANGWLSAIDSETMSNLGFFLANFNFPLKLFTLSIEVGILFIFYHIKWARYLWAGAIIMHIGILFYSGIFFWMWSLLVLLILLLFFTKGSRQAQKLMNRKHFLISVVLIGSGHFWCRPVALAWQDVPLTYTYVFMANMDDGTSRHLPPAFFAPYDYQFTLGNFKYLNSRPRLPIVWGASNKETAKFFDVDREEEEIFEYEKKYGIIFNSERKEEDFERFISGFIGNRNRKGEKNGLLRYLQPPRLLMTFPSGPFPGLKRKIRSIQIIEKTTYFSKKEGYRELRNQKIKEIQIAE